MVLGVQPDGFMDSGAGDVELSTRMKRQMRRGSQRDTPSVSVRD